MTYYFNSISQEQVENLLEAIFSSFVILSLNTTAHEEYSSGAFQGFSEWKRRSAFHLKPIFNPRVSLYEDSSFGFHKKLESSMIVDRLPLSGREVRSFKKEHLDKIEDMESEVFSRIKTEKEEFNQKMQMIESLTNRMNEEIGHADAKALVAVLKEFSNLVDWEAHISISLLEDTARGIIKAAEDNFDYFPEDEASSREIIDNLSLALEEVKLRVIPSNFLKFFFSRRREIPRGSFYDGEIDLYRIASELIRTRKRVKLRF